MKVSCLHSSSIRRPPPFKVTKLGYFAEYIGYGGLIYSEWRIILQSGRCF